MREPTFGEFYFEIEVPDYEHEGDCERHRDFVENVLNDNEITNVRVSYLVDFNYEDGYQGIVTLRGPKDLTEKVKGLDEIFDM